MTGQKILMCPPDYFGVDYVINPWMQDNKGKVDRVLAQRQWVQLRTRLAAFADIATIQPQPRLPDMVFTANAGLVCGSTAVVSRFSAVERRGEEPFFRDWFAANGFNVAEWPLDVSFEGAGDSLFDKEKDILWQGHGFRSDVRSIPLLAKIFDKRVIGLKLVDPRFYHLDTCFCPLSGGFLLYFPSAFAQESRAAIEAEVPPEKRIVVEESDALKFACNSVEVEGQVFLNAASTSLQDTLRMAGFTPNITPLTEFLKSGGAAKCLTLATVV